MYLRLRRLTPCPFDARVQPGKRSGIALDAVGDDRQAMAGKAGRIAIGVDDDTIDLRPQPRKHVQEHRLAADVEQRLLAPAHARGTAAREQHACHFAVDVACTHGSDLGLARGGRKHRTRPPLWARRLAGYNGAGLGTGTRP